jgi:DNA-binding SARP family transcriptional activator
MIYLHTLGDSLIKVGEKEIRPTSPLLFAALLYLGIERGRRVPRAALQELLFPNADERSGAHSLRQLLYKLRQLGTPLEVTSTSVTIPASRVEYAASALDHVAFEPEQLGLVGEGFLPGYRSYPSDCFERWLDDQRTEVSTRIRSRLVTELTRFRAAGDSLAAQRMATVLLRLDPFNEEATLALAEVLALGGQKREALRLLEDYVSEVGVDCPTLRLPPELLRRRVFERIEVPQHRVPLIGREDELAWLLAQFDRATAGKPTITILWGDAGIGKTRLIGEFATHLLLRKARTETAHCQPHDIERPLGALIDLAPKLLEARGALGVSPGSMSYLRRLAGEVSAEGNQPLLPAELMSARIRDALSDLLSCVAAEGPLVILIEDAHWLDRASLQLLLRTVPECAAPIHLVLTLRNKPTLSEMARLAGSIFVRQLEALDTSASDRLFVLTLGPECVPDDSARQQCLELGGGNPLFICTIAEHLRLGGAAPPTEARVVDLLKQRVRLLEGSSLLFLRSVAALGNHGTPARIAMCTGMPIGSELLALQDLADRGLVIRENGAIKCAHDLLGQVVLQDTPTPMRLAIFERVASVLEKDGFAGKQVKLLWSCAESWRLAENREQAARILRRCGEFALEIGQPIFACSALERAQEVTDGKELLPLIEETIRIADLALDSERVLKHVQHYKELVRSSPHPPRRAIELMEIDALRRKGCTVWDRQNDLRTIALDVSAPDSLRVRAARLFFYTAEQHFENASAAELYESFSDHSGLEVPFADQLHLRMVFECCFGDILRARTAALELLDLTKGVDHTARLTRLANIGRVLFRSGATSQGLDVIHDATHLAEKLGMVHTLQGYCASLASYYFYLGDTTNCRLWHDRAERLAQEQNCPFIADLVSNRIDLAIQAGDCKTARRNLGFLRAEYSYTAAPYPSRQLLAYEILIAHLENHGSLEPVELSKLTMIDDRGRESCDHDAFALALWLTLSASGRRKEASQRIRDYTKRWRRERYPIAPFLIGLLEATDAVDGLNQALCSP